MKAVRFWFTVLCVASTFVGISQDASAGFIAGPVQWAIVDGGNDHYYALYQSNGIAWTDARDNAAGLNFFGSQGHLVTITSALESNFLETSFSASIGDPNGPGGLFPFVPGIRAWIGLTDAANEGNFQWITGEPFAFTNWAPPEPNNLGNEDYVQLWRRDFGSGPLWSWNDTANARGDTDGFFVEFDGPFIPEPSSITLLIIGAIGLIGYGWRQKR